MRAIIFSVLTVFLCFSTGTASESLSKSYDPLHLVLNSSKTTYILVSNSLGVFKGIESCISKQPLLTSLSQAEPNDPEWEKMIATSIAKMKGGNNKFWINFFAVCALSLMGIVTLGAICIKVKKRYFS